MRILQISVPQELKDIMQEIQVDKYGIKIMLPKALHYLVRINTMPCITANILKQEMLSLGADAAVARGALTGKIKNTDCLLMGSLSQFRRLGEKLNHQPFGLDRVGKELLFNLNNYQKETFSIDLGRYKLSLGRRTLIMGVVNLTPDSFSADGLYQGKGQKPKTKNIIDFVDRLMQEGADIIDIGGESSRPGARAVPLKEELRRTIPVIKIIAKKIKVPISIDTCKPQVARQALDNGALIINDITGLRNSSMARLAARYKAGVVIMHMRGRPRNMQNNLVYDSLLDEVIGYLEQSIRQAVRFGGDRG